MKKPFLQISALLALGLGAGMINGLLGTGGGILILWGLSRTPAIRRRDPRTAFAATLAVTLPLSLFSAFWYYRAGHLDLGSVWLLSLVAVPGGMAGALLLRRFSPKALKRLFAVILLVSGVMLWRG